MKKTVIAALCLAGASISAPHAQAASFNCRYARLPAEVAICQSDRLHGMDERMAAKYFRLKRRLPRGLRAELAYEQKRWLRRRNGCGYNRGCLVNSYAVRIRQLNDWLASY